MSKADVFKSHLGLLVVRTSAQEAMTGVLTYCPHPFKAMIWKHFALKLASNTLFDNSKPCHLKKNIPSECYWYSHSVCCLPLLSFAADIPKASGFIQFFPKTILPIWNLLDGCILYISKEMALEEGVWELNSTPFKKTSFGVCSLRDRFMRSSPARWLVNYAPAAW